MTNPNPIGPANLPDVQALLQRGVDAVFDDFAPGLGRLGIVFVNVYAIDAGDRWFLVDSGLPGFADAVRAACDERFAGRPPEAIVLTHAHFDHAGNAAHLAQDWDVPIYAHPLEMPFLTGQSDYPPGDPTPGGAICFLSRFFPDGGYDLRGRTDLRELPDDNTIPGLDGWRWVHTPGHTPGHVSLFREADRTLVAGDALATMDLDSWAEQFARRRQACRPSVPFTPDWPTAQASVRKLADLEPSVVAAGHGLPMTGRHVAADVHDLAETLSPPEHGRYVGAPARYDAAGRVVDVPPPPDPVKKGLAVAGLAAAGIGVAAWAASRGRRA